MKVPDSNGQDVLHMPNTDPFLEGHMRYPTMWISDSGHHHWSIVAFQFASDIRIVED